jgi:hypothetical protein
MTIQMCYKKKCFYLILFIVLSINNFYSQENLTIGEVFDFEINDEFHYEILQRFTSYPEGERILVTDKYYSADSNTVTYIFSRNGYSSWFEDEPEPHLEYSFWNDTKSESYTSLDSSIYHFELYMRYDTNAIHNEAKLCLN